jgi:hypothetical protein
VLHGWPLSQAVIRRVNAKIIYLPLDGFSYDSDLKEDTLYVSLDDI